MALSVTGERVSTNWEKCLIPLPSPSSSPFTLTPSTKPGKDSREVLLRVTLMLRVVGGVLRAATEGQRQANHLRSRQESQQLTLC